MKSLILVLALLTIGCAHKEKELDPRIYSPYAGYIEGCVFGSVGMAVALGYDPYDINKQAVDAMCMNIYLHKLETENIQRPQRRVKEKVGQI